MSGTSSRKVTLNHSFQLPGMDSPYPGGTFDVMVDIVELDVPWPAYRTNLTLLVPSGGRIEAWPISGEELDKLLAADLQKGADTGHS